MSTPLRLLATLLVGVCLHAVAHADGAPVSRTDGVGAHPWYDTPMPRGSRTARPRASAPGSDRPRLGAAIVVDGPEAFGAALAERRRHLAEHGPWLTPNGPSNNARQLLEQIADVDAHGLDPERYGLAELRDAFVTLEAAVARRAADTRATAADPTTIERVARAMLARRLESAFTRLANDFGRGVVDGRAVEPRLYHAPPRPEVERLRSALASGEIDVRDALESLLPPHEEYARLVETMRELLAERATGVTRTRVGPGTTLDADSHHPDVTRVRRRLTESGDLTEGGVIASMFDTELLAAVRAFQRRHGLEPSGAVDAATRRALDRDPEDDIRAVALSLERWRWLPRALGERHVLVNLPDYRLTVRDGGEEVLEMPVVIGAAEHATPSFSREMSYLEFNPTWTVPASIANSELVPLEQRRPGYLRSRAFDVLRYVGGQLRPVPETELSASDFARRPFPYVLRQRGGPGNALGRLKFMMPNPFSIYLHDTPAKHHFALHERAYSHGCIRLAEPERLARLLLERDGTDAERVRALLDGARTRRVVLERPVPTHLVYLTAWVDEDGALHRRRDVYGRDAALAAALTAEGSVLSALARESAAPSPDERPLVDQRVAAADDAY